MIFGVSILVIVEVTLKSDNLDDKNLGYTSFNPCYSGSNSKIASVKTKKLLEARFNPCYSGSNSKMKMLLDDDLVNLLFQSLL